MGCSQDRLVATMSSANRAMSMSDLRRRRNVSTNSNGSRRKSFAAGGGNAEQQGKRGSRGFPKSLAPFVHLRDTSKIEKELDEIEKSRHGFKIPIQTDLEKQDIPNRTITYNRENSMHTSFLTNDSVNDFNTSGLTNDSNDDLENKANGRMPRRNPRKSHDSGCHDEIVNTDDGETDNDSKSVPIDPDTLYGKFQLSRRSVGKLVNNEYVQITIILLIVLNGILIGLSTTAWVQDSVRRAKVVENIDLVFLVIFTIEIIMQLYYYALALFLDAWLVFDLVVVILSWCAIWITNEDGEEGSFQVLRAFRIFRGARLVTRVAPLRDLVLALGEVLPKMYAIVGLLIVIFYVFAVLFTEQFSDVPLEYDYFTTLHHSFLSCFQMMTMEWVDICRPLMEFEKQAWWSIVAFVMIAGFIVFNLIVAVVVEAVAATEDSARIEDEMELDGPAADVFEANERIDLLNSHLYEMMQQQEQIQKMLETMAAELLDLETERMKAQQREKSLREEIDRRIEDQKKSEEDDSEEPASDALRMISMQFLRKIEEKKALRKEEEAAAAATATASDHESLNSSSVKRRPPKKSLSSISGDGSGKSIGSLHSGDSIRSIPNQIDSPSHRNTISGSTRPSSSVRPSNFSRLRSADSSASGETNERRSRAISNWKSLIVAAQKDPTI